MAESSWPTVAGSRSVADNEYELMAAGYITDGVIGQWTQSSPVFADSTGRQVKIRANFTAVVAGHGYSSGSSDSTRSVTANASGSTRIDLVVLGLDRTTLEVTSYVKAGTPGAGVPPALQRDARGLTTGKWEIPLARVTVVNGASNLAPADVTDIGWYSRGETVATTSTASFQPSPASYTTLIHTDTGHKFESVQNLWRRHPWQSAGGIVGGQRYTSGAAFGIGIGTSETLIPQSSGAVLLRANRRFRVQAFVRVSQGTDPMNAVMVVKIRDTNLAGTQRAERGLSLSNNATIFQHDIVADYVTGGSDETKTFVVTGFVSAGLWNVYSGTADQIVGVFVFDVGPATPSVVTTIP